MTQEGLYTVRRTGLQTESQGYRQRRGDRTKVRVLLWFSVKTADVSFLRKVPSGSPSVYAKTSLLAPRWCVPTTLPPPPRSEKDVPSLRLPYSRGTRPPNLSQGPLVTHGRRASPKRIR